MRKVIVDCDLTVVRSDLEWVKWLQRKASEEDDDIYAFYLLRDELKIPYDLTEIYKDASVRLGGGMNFWKELDYTNLTPMEGSVDALGKISKHCSIIFASHIEGNHGRTKYNWLKKHFPFLDGVMFTREKYLLNSNEVVGVFDDRLSHLSGFEVHKRIQIDTPYTQDGYEETIVAQSFSDWRDFNVEKWLKEVL